MLSLTGCEIAPEGDPAELYLSHFEHGTDDLCESAGVDPYTGLAFTPEAFDVDHLESAAELWVSGASD